MWIIDRARAFFALIARAASVVWVLCTFVFLVVLMSLFSKLEQRSERLSKFRQDRKNRHPMGANPSTVPASGKLRDSNE